MIWLTDIHVDCKSKSILENLYQRLSQQEVDFLCITGDIAEDKQSIEFMETLAKQVNLPIYFVLGNHDFYRSEIYSFQNYVYETFEKNPLIHYLSFSEEIHLSKDTAIIGVDNWYDLQSGDFHTSEVNLRDFQEIDNFLCLKREELPGYLQDFSEKILEKTRGKLKKVFSKYSHVILLVHVPPFREACLYNNSIADERWAPFFVHDLLGKFLLAYMKEHKEKSLTVLSGHTHHRAEYIPLPNLVVKVGSCPDDDIEWEKISYR